MADCPLADDCPEFSERIEGMGCQHYGDRGGKEWCSHYNMPIEDLKTAPVKPQQEVVVDVTDIHESGAGVGKTEEGFVVLVDGILPDARARVKITNVHGNHAQGEELERLPMDEDDDTEEEEDAATEETEEDDTADNDGPDRPDLGSRDNFWGS